MRAQNPLSARTPRRSARRLPQRRITINPVLVEIYSTVIPSMPFIIAAYALLWAVLLIYVFVSMRGMKKTEQQIAVLEEAVAELKAK